VANEEVLMFSYFLGRGDGLNLAFTEDGYHWKALKENTIFLKPNAGQNKLMRDPFILYDHDNVFHLVWTLSWHERGIGYASSKDLINWSTQQYIPVMEHEPLAKNCWAPEIIYDDAYSQYIIYWASTINGRFQDTDAFGDEGLNHRMYYVTTKDFKEFSETKLLYDGGFNVIDATIVKDVDRYLMFLKNETLTPPEKNIRLVISKNIFEDFEKPSLPITGNYWAEGPSAVKIKNDWIVYFDKYKINKIGAVCSNNLLDWTDISDLVSFPEGAQHGAVFKAPRSVLENLKKL
jgi:beta-xylosidase